MKVLMVCTGNICRSPMAEAVLRRRAGEAGLSLEIDSAGLGAWHIGEPPDRRAQAALKERGYDPGDQRARRVTTEDLADFDLILAMDRSHLAALERAAARPAGEKIKLLLDYAPQATRREVPDPYYGGRNGFDFVLDLIESAVDGLVADLKGRSASG